MLPRFHGVCAGLLAVAILGVMSCEPPRRLTNPTKEGEVWSGLPDSVWDRCRTQVTKDLRFNPDSAKFALADQSMQAVKAGRMTDYTGPLVWRFQAEAQVSNFAGTLVRKDLRCYVFLAKDSPTETVEHELLDPGESPSAWEAGS